MRTPVQPRRAGLAVLAASLLAVTACESREAKPPDAASAPAAATVQPEYKPTATIRELMDSVVDPSADVIWLSVRTEVTKKGAVDYRPRTDEDWAQVRRGAIALQESANLLMIPGRTVGHPSDKSAAPGVELDPREIDALIAKDRNAWNARAIVLHEVGGKVVDAINAKDVDQIFSLGAEIEGVCESCHRQYWYPGEVIPPLPRNIPLTGR